MGQELTDDRMTEKILELTEEFNQYVFEHPEILDHMPEQATLVLLDADDPAFNDANVRLAQSSMTPARGEYVYVRMKKRVRVVELVEWEAEVMPSPKT